MPSVAVVTARSPTGSSGGAERLYEGLLAAFRSAGWKAQEVPIYFDETSFEAAMEGYDAARRLDVLRHDLVISTKAPTYLVKHPNHVCWLVHTMRVYYDLFERTFPNASQADFERRREVMRRDTLALSQRHIRRFAIGHTVAERLMTFNGLSARTIHPPSPLRGFHTRGSDSFFFTASRLHPWKRIDLLIQAILMLEHDVSLRIAGVGDDLLRLRRLAKGSPRVQFLGQISDQELLNQFASCRGVPFVPLNEDYGYITLEAFLSRKPVLTCVDSGEVAKLVSATRGGKVVQSDARSIAEVLGAWDQTPGLAADLGSNGYKWASEQAWEFVIKEFLLES